MNVFSVSPFLLQFQLQLEHTSQILFWDMIFSKASSFKSCHLIVSPKFIPYSSMQFLSILFTLQLSLHTPFSLLGQLLHNTSQLFVNVIVGFSLSSIIMVCFIYSTNFLLYPIPTKYCMQSEWCGLKL